MIGGQAACNPLAKSVPQHECGPAHQAADDFGDVVGVVVQRQVLQRPGAATHAAWLRAQNVEAGCGKAFGDVVEVLGITR